MSFYLRVILYLSHYDSLPVFETGFGHSLTALSKTLRLEAALVNKLVLCVWLSGGALEVGKLRLRL